MAINATAQESDNDKIKAVEFSAQMSFSDVENFLERFKNAVKSNKCLDVAQYVGFPLKINTDSKVKELWNRTAFCRYFPILFSAKRSDIILKQNIFDMPVGYRGLMFGNGNFWVQPVCLNENKCTNESDYILRLKVVNLGE